MSATGKGEHLPQIAINWLLQRSTVSSVISGARNEEQLRQSLGAVAGALLQFQRTCYMSDILTTIKKTGRKDSA
jgi:aryl-alcohol dehydrogenase-like predicted oxidoreductase